jgi:hypothetical protein
MSQLNEMRSLPHLEGVVNMCKKSPSKRSAMRNVQSTSSVLTEPTTQLTGSKCFTLLFSVSNDLCAGRALLYAINHVSANVADSPQAPTSSTCIEGTKWSTEQERKSSSAHCDEPTGSNDRDFDRTHDKLSKTPVRPPATGAAPDFS